MAKTGRVHISEDRIARPCSAKSEESCRAGGARGHFDSIEEANAHIEELARQENESFGQLKKERFTNKETDRYGNVVETGLAYNPIMQRSRVAERMAEEINSYVKENNLKASVSVKHSGASIKIDIDPNLKDSEAYEIVNARIVPTKATEKLIKEISARAWKFDRVQRIPGEEPTSHFGTEITFLNEEEKTYRKAQEIQARIHELSTRADTEDWEDERYDREVTPLVNEIDKARTELKAYQERRYVLYSRQDDEDFQDMTMDSLYEEALEKVVASNRSRDWWGIKH